MRQLLGFLIVAVAALAAAADDEVKLKNGDRLTGKLAGLDGGKLTIETAHSGKVVVDFAQVASMKTEGDVTVNLASGQDVSGKLEYADGKLKVAGTDTDMAGVKAFNKPPPAWHGNVNLGARSTDGNTHNRSGILTAELIRKTDVNEIIVRGIYRYGETDGVLTERNAYGIAKYSHTLTGDLYAYASVEALGDEFKDIDLQLIVSAGLGYTFVREKWMDLSAEAGFAYIDTSFEVAPDESHPGARASATGRIDLPLNFVFKDVFTIYPNFDESQDFQIRNEATLANALGAGWSFIAGVITEYDRTPSAGRTRHDDTYFAGLGFTF
jgi:putative salt-induced outer membrane protein YdiY